MMANNTFLIFRLIIILKQLIFFLRTFQLKYFIRLLMLINILLAMNKYHFMLHKLLSLDVQ